MDKPQLEWEVSSDGFRGTMCLQKSTRARHLRLLLLAQSATRRGFSVTLIPVAEWTGRKTQRRQARAGFCEQVVCLSSSIVVSFDHRRTKVNTSALLFPNIQNNH